MKWEVLFGEYLPVTDFVMDLVTDFVTDLVGMGPVTVRIGPEGGREGKAIGICLVVPFTIPVSCGCKAYGLTEVGADVHAAFGISGTA